MLVRLIVPITGLTEEAIEERLSYLRGIADLGTEVEAVQVETGPLAIESKADAVLAGPEILRLVTEAERDGVDAAIIWCGGDPALAAARELVDIPVIGPGEAMTALSMVLGHRPCRVVPEIPVLEMRNDLDATVEALRVEIEERIERREGDVFVLGCLALWGLGERFRESLGVPILDGAEASLKVAELVVKLGLKHSRITYPLECREGPR
jgi:allantoin racemase